MKTTYLINAIIIILFSCDSKPKVLMADEPSTTQLETGTSKIENSSDHLDTDVHQVVANEILNTKKYTYINVSEKGEKFWIAIAKKDIKLGNTYYYRGGLKKTNFFSQEFNRTFDVVYLVSTLIDQSEHPGNNEEGKMHSQEEEPEVRNVAKPMNGSITLKELMSNKAKFKDQKILVSGVCVKANYQIMGRNWYHIQNKKKEKEFDLTITSQDQIKVGDEVNFEGIVALDKDFGAGYRYEIILESSTLKR